MPGDGAGAAPAWPGGYQGDLTHLQFASLVFIAAATALNYTLAPGFVAVFRLSALCSGMPPALAGPFGVSLGVVYAVAVPLLRRWMASDRGITWALVSVGGSVVALAMVLLLTAPQSLIEFFFPQFFLFPASFMAAGAVLGLRWAVAGGGIVQFLIALDSPAGPEDLPAVLAFGLAYLLALEVAFSTASFLKLKDREIGETRKRREYAEIVQSTRAVVRAYIFRLAGTVGVVAAIMVVLVAVFLTPRLFGTAYDESFVSSSLVSFVLTASAALLVLAVGLLVPRSAGGRLALLKPRLMLLLRRVMRWLAMRRPRRHRRKSRRSAAGRRYRTVKCPEGAAPPAPPPSPRRRPAHSPLSP